MKYRPPQRTIRFRSGVLRWLEQSSNNLGTINIAREETEWRFTPREPWVSGGYQLVVDTALEDLAGNHIGQPFDIDTFKQVTKSISTQTISLPFAVY